MDELKRRSRMISVRISEDEYGRLKSLCESQGVRSISDLARAAMWTLIGDSGGDRPESLESRVKRLDSRVSTLDREVERLTRLISVSRPRMAK